MSFGIPRQLVGFSYSPKLYANTTHHRVADTSSLLAYYESLLALLQQLSQTKSGATYVLKCGLFDSVRESQLFAADPDIGIGQSSSTPSTS